MPVFSTPPWNAPANGTLNDSWTLIQEDNVNQFLGTHASYALYSPGSQVITPFGTGVLPWAQQLSTQDITQPFTQVGTTIGYVTIPVLAVGNGADLLVSICTDSGGSPAAMLNQTRVPAEWITQLSAVTAVPGPASVAPITQATGNPLATSVFNSAAIGTSTPVPYSPPATGSANIIDPTVVASGNYLINLGGANQVTQANVANVFIATASGTTLGPLIPQPAMPQTNWTGAAVATTDTLVFAGGLINGTDTSPTADVFCASWDPSAGVIGSWSAQAPLPTASQYAGAASWNETVYLIGGFSNAAGYLSNVYYATVTNGQITAWNTGPSLPQQLSNVCAITINGFLIVTGGENNTIQSSSTYYAAINSDGSISQWLDGPPAPGAAINGGNQIVATSNAIIAYGSGEGIVLGVSPSGLATSWLQVNNASYTSKAEWLLIPSDTGVDYQLFTADPIAGNYRVGTVTPTTYLQVPIHTPSLTNGTTYHVLMQQRGGDENNYLRLHLDTNAITGNLTALTATSDTYSWTPLTPSGTCVPINVQANLQPSFQEMPIQMVDDVNARIATLVSATTPDQRLLGICEAVQFRRAVNSNPGFELELYPWAVNGGTYAQSSTQAYRSNYSCQITPDGVSSVAYIQSEKMPCLPGQSVTVSAWVWFTSAVTTDASVSVNWFDKTGGYVSTSSNNVSVPATTWTRLTNTYTAPTTGTLPYQFTLDVALSGTPATTNVYYVDDAYVYYVTGGDQLATVTEIGWSGTWPGNVYPPTGTTQLA